MKRLGVIQEEANTSAIDIQWYLDFFFRHPLSAVHIEALAAPCDLRLGEEEESWGEPPRVFRLQRQKTSTGWCPEIRWFPKRTSFPFETMSFFFFQPVGVEC